MLLFLYIWMVVGIIDTMFDIYLKGDKIYRMVGIEYEDIKYLRFGYFIPIINIIILIFYLDIFNYLNKD